MCVCVCAILSLGEVYLGSPEPSSPFLQSPDPIPVLEQAVAIQHRLQSAQDHELQNSKLRETLEEYKTEFAQVKSQGEPTTTSLSLLHPPPPPLSLSLSLSLCSHPLTRAALPPVPTGVHETQAHVVQW